MQRRSLTTFGFGAAVGATASALLTAGLLPRVAGDRAAPSGEVAASPRPAVARPASAARALPAFDGCEGLRAWYVDAALPEVGPWGLGDGAFYGRGPVVADQDGVRANRDLLSKAVGSSDTGTNVQEADVDEPDVVKTDGEVLVRVVGRQLVVSDVTGERPRQLSRIELPGRNLSQELLLVGDSVLVVGQEGPPNYWGPAVDFGRIARPWGTGSGRTHLTTVDLSAPGAPVVVAHQRVDGDLVAAREYGDGTVRVAVDTGYPVLDFVMPNRDRTRAEARRLNRKIVRDAAIEDWLPGLRRGDGRGRHPLLDCSDVRHPRERSGFGTISMLTLDPRDPPGLAATAITAAGDLVYSSADRLYVATLRSDWWAGPIPMEGEAGSPRRRVVPPETAVHAFALAGTSTTYVASGTVPGTVRDRWSFDEHDGLLRVAAAQGGGWMPTDNALSVLAEEGDRLRVVGSVDGLGRRERIESVRWFDDLAVLVTFRQTDPLYTVDLSAPRSPRVRDALKIRGFSAYLHPVGGDLVLGLGQDATGSGRWLGGQVATFDLGDPRAVTREDTYGFGRDTGLVTEDPRAFSYLPDERLGFVVVDEWRAGRSRLVALRVGEHGALTAVRTWRLRGWSSHQVRTVPLGDGRVAIVDRRVRIDDVG